MITIISPAKTFREDFIDLKIDNSELIFHKKTKEIIEILKNYTIDELATLMNMSLNLAKTNYYRYEKFYDENVKEMYGILAFNGELYKGLGADNLKGEDIDFSQDNLRILSGLYGIIRPLDKIKEYRLEMGTKLKNNLADNLYGYWRESLTEYIIDDIGKSSGDKILINLASSEYSKALNLKEINSKFKVINIDFKENKNGKLKSISMYSKKARGKMTRYIIQNKIDKLNEIKKFNEDEYVLNIDLSNDENLIFTRNI